MVNLAIWQALVVAVAAAGCGGLVVVTDGAAAPVAHAASPAGGGGGAGAGGGAAFAWQDGEYLVADQAFTSGWVRGWLAKQTTPPGAAGEAGFMLLHDGATKASTHFHKLHPATAADLQPGAVIACLDAKGHDNNYRLPQSRDEAMKKPWFLARVVDVTTLPQGFVQTSGGFFVAVTAAWVVEGDSSPRGQVDPAEDRQFLHADHYIVANGGLPEKDWLRAWVAVPIAMPSAATKGEGHFITTSTGGIAWTAHAWKTRLATAADLKVGTFAFVIDHKDDANAYRNPKSRQEALVSPWFVAKITDTGDLFKNMVTVGGQYKANVDAIRVIVP